MKIGNFYIGKYAEGQAVSAKEIGATGTNQWHGFVNEEFTSDLMNENGIVVYNKMRKSDATINAVLTMIKLPMLRANYYIECEDERLKEYAERLLFVEHDKSFLNFLREILLYLDFGVMVFEKVYKKTDYYFIDTFAFRAPSSYYKWELDNGEEGLVQNLPTPEAGKTSQPQIPQWKILYFGNNLEGKNKWCTSVLRSAYKHWFMKDFAYRLDMMANEKWAMGIPVINLPKNYTDTDFTNAKEMAANIRSNEQAYLILPEGWNASILTGTKDSEGLYKTITHHDRQIAKNVLAQVIEMGQETGTQALGQTTSDFFLKGVEAYATYVIEVINELIKEMVDMNFGEQKEYPKLKFADLYSRDIGQFANAVLSLANAGFLTGSEKSEEFIRQMLNMPELEEDEYEEEQERKAEVVEQMKPSEDTDEMQPEEAPKEEEEDKEVEEEVEKMTEFVEEDLNPTEREKQFIKDITANEEDLQAMWNDETEPTIRKYEQKIKDYLKKGYSLAQTEKKGGVTVLTKKGNTLLAKKMQNGVSDIIKQMEAKLYSKPVAKRLVTRAGNNAVKTYRNLAKLAKYYDIVIPEGQLRSFEEGYISNMRGNIENGGGRQAIEVIVENFGGEAPLVEVLRGVDRLTFNDNNIKLSNLTHIRGAFKTTIQSNALNEGFTNFKMVLPLGIAETLEKSGETAKNVFNIGPSSYWASRRADTTANPLATSLHHNSQEYFYPIETEDLDFEIKLSKKQRKELLDKLK